LDRFKEVNDAFGHQVGDEVLKCVVDVLRRELRSEDIVARYGGEEFAVIALAANAETGCELAERLRRRLEEASMPAGVSRMTITVGVAATSAMSSATLAQLIAGADEALYRGKQAGRNRVEVYRPIEV
ncbi:MAG: GGDEF domain-containing protein, partial [Thermoanaerobaculia bacterium]